MQARITHPVVHFPDALQALQALNTVVENSGLPTRIAHQIYGWKDYQTSKAEIARFKDDEGKAIETHFKLRD